ncbi:cysteine--tRNA ligase [Bartonella sp. TP]|uniref:cysteine--tRNA ligase n=1 Tax=Bartonella sp. TP TaxID=3057550 RepID=UPI0025B005BC|nr:cysteine--tRNA ligase [Bartonella sp. TP]WJW80136.1 cysteine--tRNA ligase [Bartonella sp. TP]
MYQLWLFNTLTRQKNLFTPIDKKNLRMYVCGPTVYDSIHIGNARPLIVFDILFRLLRYIYGEEHVVYVRNITDVDDKINARAKSRYGDIDLNAAIHQLTTLTNLSFQEDAAALGCLPPSSQPRVTEHMENIKAMIERLLQKKRAYIEQDHILFSVESFADYGKLSGRSVGEMLAGARVEVAPYKHGDMDFVLWKPAKPGEPSWPSPGGIAVGGRPGWHIECSAMSMAELLEPYGGGLESTEAEKNVFDIHGGGIDLMFPHHENEIAQSRCSLGATKMANFWLHNGYLQVDGKKMSKSENNFITVKDIIGSDEAMFRNKGNVVRFAMLQTHYRSNFNWTNERYEQAHNELAKWQEKLQGVPTQDVAIDEFIEALCDDLNTPSAITHMREYFKNNELVKLKLSLEFLGINVTTAAQLNKLEQYKHLIEQRAKAIANRDWHTADEIRLILQSKGVEVRDWKDESGARQTEYLHKT